MCIKYVLCFVFFNLIHIASIAAQKTVQEALVDIKSLETKQKVEFKLLAKLYNFDDDTVKIAVLQAIQRRHLEQLIDIAQHASTHSSTQVRQAGIYTLAQLSMPLSIWVTPLLKSTLTPDIVKVLVQALGESQKSEASTFLYSLLKRDSDLEIIDTIYNALHRLLDAQIDIQLKGKHILFAFQNDLSLKQKIQASTLLSRYLTKYPHIKKSPSWQRTITQLLAYPSNEIQKYILFHVNPIQSIQKASQVWQVNSKNSLAIRLSTAHIFTHKEHIPLLTPLFEQWITYENELQYSKAYLEIINALYQHKRLKGSLLRTLQKVDRYFIKLSQKPSVLASYSITPLDVDHIRCGIAGLLDMKAGKPQKLKRCALSEQGRIIKEQYVIQVIQKQKSKRKRKKLFLRYYPKALPMTQAKILELMQAYKLDRAFEELLVQALSSDYTGIQLQALKLCLHQRPILLAQNIMNTVTVAALNRQLEVLLTGIEVLASMKIEDSSDLLKEYAKHQNLIISKAAKKAFVKVKEGQNLLRKRKTIRPPGEHYFNKYRLTSINYSHVVISTSRGELQYKLLHKDALHMIKMFYEMNDKYSLLPCVLAPDHQKNIGCISHLPSDTATDDPMKSIRDHHYTSIQLSEKYVLYPENNNFQTSWSYTLNFKSPFYDYTIPSLVLTRLHMNQKPRINSAIAVLTKGEEVLKALTTGDLLLQIKFINL